MTPNIFQAGTCAAGIALFALAGPAAAQQEEQQAGAASPPAAECRAELQQFTQVLSEDQLWVQGWGQAWGYGVGPGAVPPVETDVSADPAAAPQAGGLGMAPWAGAGMETLGVGSPRFQIQSLYQSAHVLAHQGNQEGCAYILAQLYDTYRNYVSRLQEAGINPDEVSSWRQEQLALAEPVGEVARTGRFTVDDVTGADIRNAQDEYLGSVSDVAFDPGSGAITYVIIARGGFLGIGQEHVAVPWSMFRSTPGFNTLILNVSADTLEAAPTVDPGSFADASTISNQDEQVNRFWEEQS